MRRHNGQILITKKKVVIYETPRRHQTKILAKIGADLLLPQLSIPNLRLEPSFYQNPEYEAIVCCMRSFPRPLSSLFAPFRRIKISLTLYKNISNDDLFRNNIKMMFTIIARVMCMILCRYVKFLIASRAYKSGN